MIRTLAPLAAVLAVCAALPALAKDNWAILPEHATCIVENLEAYIAEAGGKPAVIFVKYCPTANTEEVMVKMQTNSGVLPSVTVAPDGATLDEVIVYSEAELKCLADLQLDLEAEIVQLPQKPCDP